MKFLLVVATIVAAVIAEAPGGSGSYGAPQGGYLQSQGNFGGNSFRPSSGSENFGGGYSSSSNSGFGSGGFGSSGSGSFGGAAQGQGQGQADDYTPKTYRYVSVHVAPEEPSTGEARTIRVPGGGNKHVNIIFVKTPSASGNQQTEVILPQQDEQKNLVYVLLKKEDGGSNIKIRRPEAKAPKKPEVYFIRYNNVAEAQQGQGQKESLGGIGGGSGFSSGSRAPSSQYGVN